MSQGFVVLKTLGQGSYGTVKQVRRKADNRIYAMKVINVQKMDQRDKADQLNEIRILASIFHPNVLAYYEAFVENGQLFIVTEFAELGDLDGEIQQRQRACRPFTEQEVWSVFLQCLSGLRELHNAGILHRDIKGQNVLRFQNPQDPKRPIYKLADFGVSKVIEDSERDFARTQIGTPYYLSPEIWQNKKYNASADIFSMGVLLYEIMSFKHPFEGRDMKELNNNVLRGKYAPLSSQRYSQTLRDLCYSMLSQNPDARPSVKEIFLQPEVEKHFCDSPISVCELNIGQETALEANVNWEDPELIQTIQLNPKLMAAMAGRVGAYQNPYQRPYYGGGGMYGQRAPQPQSAADVQEYLPEAEYEKRRQFEKLQKVHDERAKRADSAPLYNEAPQDDDPLKSLMHKQLLPQNSPPVAAPIPVAAVPPKPALPPQAPKPVQGYHNPYAKAAQPVQQAQGYVNPYSQAQQVQQQQKQVEAYRQQKVQMSPVGYKPSSANAYQKPASQPQYQPYQQYPAPPKKPVAPAAGAVEQSQARKMYLEQNKGNRFW